MKMNKEEIKVSAKVKTFLRDLYNQIEYELRDDYEDGLEKANQEIDRLNNIINELEKWLGSEIENIKMTYSQENGNYFNMNYVIDTYQECLDKLKELKENK